MNPFLLKEPKHCKITPKSMEAHPKSQPPGHHRFFLAMSLVYFQLRMIATLYYVYCIGTHTILKDMPTWMYILRVPSCLLNWTSLTQLF